MITFSCALYCIAIKKSLTTVFFSIDQVVYQALKGDEDATDVKTQNLLRVTNIRINFTKLNTLGDDIIDNRYRILWSNFVHSGLASILG